MIRSKPATIRYNQKDKLTEQAELKMSSQESQNKEKTSKENYAKALHKKEILRKYNIKGLACLLCLGTHYQRNCRVYKLEHDTE